MHIHLDPLGGLAGDMFAAAILDARPELGPALLADLDRAGLTRLATVSIEPHHDHALTGTRFEVRQAAPADPHGHRHLREIRELLRTAGLAPGVTGRAVDIFERLGEAESRVHGVPIDAIAFHEVGAWDSIVDIVSAAWLIEHAGATGWSCHALPLGRGRIASAHGRLPVPAPATALLLEGYPTYQDEFDGERVTPTGAAIVRHLAPDFTAQRTVRTLRASGNGFGTRTWPGMSNILRVLVFEAAAGAPAGAGTYVTEQIIECAFEVDDQTPEDLAVALDALRTTAGIVDATQAPVQGKKGRLAVAVRVLARPEALPGVLDTCFEQTTTLGVRWQHLDRAVVQRDAAAKQVGNETVRVKRARRPGGAWSAKAEMDDVAGAAGGHAGRQQLRRAAESAHADTPASATTEIADDV